MEHLGNTAGYAALGFWIFIAVVVASGVWDGIRKRESQHETLRRIIESGQSIDDELVNKLIELTGGNKDTERDFRIAATILIFIAPGLAVFGWVMGIFLAEQLTWVMLAVAALLVFVAAGLYGAALLAKRWQTTGANFDRTSSEGSRL